MQFTDQIGNTIRLGQKPGRIVSLVPSQTELLFDLGLDHQIIGITKFCLHPAEKVKSKLKIGGTKNVDIGKILSLNPDLIIANKEENEQSQIEKLQKEFPVWISDIVDLTSSIEMITSIGELTRTSEKAHSLTHSINLAFKNFQPLHKHFTVAYFIWKDPYMVAASNTFINSMLLQCGFKNVFDDLERYPIINLSIIEKVKPDVIFLSSEPYPFKDRHAEQLQQDFPGSKVHIVDGEMFSWYGSRLQYAPAYFKTLLNKL